MNVNKLPYEAPVLILSSSLQLLWISVSSSLVMQTLMTSKKAKLSSKAPLFIVLLN